MKTIECEKCIFCKKDNKIHWCYYWQMQKSEVMKYKRQPMQVDKKSSCGLAR